MQNIAAINITITRRFKYAFKVFVEGRGNFRDFPLSAFGAGPE